ncbi:MAG: tRNA (adenosine(37)-N6)-threonylcarbamoyltransferase complex ATPase subunit type 1 TsaE [Planctomycetota bacterium]|nr:MAG: tRNA (adenosine(37)-N6)-threonylcarbamoyltransferase complex ATPase subunit type 1 TsaE [Planctomycetota bacterium]
MSASWETIETDSPEQTMLIGAGIGRLLRAGDVVALSGPLGAGKTLFVKGLAAGLGVPETEPVVSPTFVLVRQYEGRLRLAHCDAYRLTSATELDDLGLAEVLNDEAGVVAIEWADRFPQAFDAPTWEVELEHAGLTRRTLRIRSPRPELNAALRELLRAPQRAANAAENEIDNSDGAGDTTPR